MIRFLLAQGVPKKFPMDFRCPHGTPPQVNLLPPFFRQRFAVSASPVAQMPQTSLKPRAPGPVPILCGQPIAVITAEVHSTLSKD